MKNVIKNMALGGLAVLVYGSHYAFRSYVAVSGLKFEKADPRFPSGWHHMARGTTLTVGGVTISNEAYHQLFSPNRTRPGYDPVWHGGYGDRS